MEISLIGAIVALIIAIGLILKKVSPAYGMMLGALIGAIVGGATITQTITIMFDGASSVISAVLRILAAGVLAGVLIESGAAKTIAETLVAKFGNSLSLLALAVATMILTMVGVFIDISVITIAPIALAIAKKTNISKLAILVAMVGGGKSGNIISANPNAIAAADAFDVPLISLMLVGLIPAIFGILLTFILATKLKNKGELVTDVIIDETHHDKPKFLAALAGPLVAVILLALRPLFDIAIDPFIALPVGGIVGVLAMHKTKKLNEYTNKGLLRMSGVAIMLLGTGTLAGVIANSELKTTLESLISASSLPSFTLAPISGMLMSFATASTTAGTTTASQLFGPTLLDLGVPALAAAAMIQAGATVLDHMPHGSFFHSTGGSLGMSVKARLRAIPYESVIGLTLTIIMVAQYLIYNYFIGG